MRNILGFITAVVLMAIGSIFVSATSADAKNMAVIYGGKIFSSDGDHSSYDLPGMNYGAELRIGLDSSERFFLGFGAMFGQKMNMPGWSYGEIADGWNGMSVQGIAEIYEKDISQFNIPRDESYLLVYSQKTKSGTANLATVGFYVSRPLNEADKRGIEPVLGFVFGASITQDVVEHEFYYHPVIEFLMPGALDPRSGFMPPGDNGSHRLRQSKYKTKGVGGPSFGINFHFSERLSLASQGQYLFGFGPRATAGLQIVLNK